MNRVIEFRVWHTDAKIMLYGTPKEVFQWVEDKQPVIPLQFTGLLDKNGKKIFEGDILKGTYFKNGSEYVHEGEVKYVLSAFKVVGVGDYYGMHQELNSIYEVIGNIYEDSNLCNS